MFPPATILADEGADGVYLSRDPVAGFPAPCGNLMALKVAADLGAENEALLRATAG